MDLPNASPCSIGQEVDDVKALCEVIGEPMVIVGHSSGGVVALESLVALPSAFAGAVLFEPPVVVGPPLGGEALERAQAAIAAGKPGKAMAIFVRDVVGVPRWYGPIVQMWVGAVPKMRKLANFLSVASARLTYIAYLRKCLTIGAVRGPLVSASVAEGRRTDPPCALPLLRPNCRHIVTPRCSQAVPFCWHSVSSC